jgi:hypothetical protein
VGKSWFASFTVCSTFLSNQMLQFIWNILGLVYVENLTGNLTNRNNSAISGEFLIVPIGNLTWYQAKIWAEF